MALDTSIVKNVMMANLPGGASADQEAAIDNFVNALKLFVESATVTYTAGLIAPPGTAGGPVTGVSGMTLS